MIISVREIAAAILILPAPLVGLVVSLLTYVLMLEDWHLQPTITVTYACFVTWCIIVGGIATWLTAKMLPDGVAAIWWKRHLAHASAAYMSMPLVLAHYIQSPAQVGVDSLDRVPKLLLAIVCLIVSNAAYWMLASRKPYLGMFRRSFSKADALFLVVVIGIIVVYFAAVFRILRDDGEMTFIRTPHGAFVDSPRVVEQDGVLLIQWTLPVSCGSNGIEYRDVDFKQDVSRLWGGTSAECAPSKNVFACTAKIPADVQIRKGKTLLQTHSYSCTDGAYFISDMIGL